jgi:hypothetical protein
MKRWVLIALAFALTGCGVTSETHTAVATRHDAEAAFLAAFVKETGAHGTEVICPAVENQEWNCTADGHKGSGELEECVYETGNVSKGGVTFGHGSVSGVAALPFCAVALSHPNPSESSTTSTTPQGVTSTGETAPVLTVGSGQGTGANQCGGELAGTSDTSCPFAQEVLSAVQKRYAVLHAPPARVTAYSPTTHRSYHLNCVIVEEGKWVECATGTAIVTFPISRARESASSGSSSEVGAAAVAACKQAIQAQTTLPASAKSKLEAVCSKAASGDQAAVKKAAEEVCEEVVNRASPPAGAAREQALAACKSK